MSFSQARSMASTSRSGSASAGTWEWAVMSPLAPLLVLQAELGELFTHLVHVEAELARGQALALVFLVGNTLLCGFGHLARVSAVHDAYAVVVRDHHVARFDPL